MKTFLLQVGEKQFMINFEDLFEEKWNGYKIIDWAMSVFDTSNVSFRYIKSKERKLYKNATKLNCEEVLQHSKFILNKASEKQSKIEEKEANGIKITAVIFKDKTYYIKEGERYQCKCLEYGKEVIRTLCQYDLMCSNSLYQTYTFKQDAYRELRNKAINLANTRIIFSDNAAY